jgi:serine/threonine protein kinase
MLGEASSELPTAGLRAGLEIGGRYRLVAPLGKGGMGEVWEAQHVVIGRTVAIKLLLRQGAGGPDAAIRLQREAEVIAKLEHPNIVGVFDFGHVAAGQPFIVMERLSGRPLSDVLRDGGPLPWTQARDIAAQIAAGLACAHEVGVVHRDLKPSNVFVLDDARGRLAIKLIDFGLAKLTQLAPGDRALTRSGAVFGTPAYMAPEQARGEPLDGRVDLYALGAMLYEMIVGEPLWRRSTIAQLVYCHLFEPAPTIRSRVPEVPAELDALVARCLCKDRAMRPVDTEAVRSELLAAGTGTGTTLLPNEAIVPPDPELRARYATVVAPVERVATPSSRLWLVPAVVGVAVTIGVVLGVRLWPRTEATTDSIEHAGAPEPTPVEPAASPSISPSPVASPRDAPPSRPPAAPPEEATLPASIPVAGDIATPRPSARVRPTARSGDATPAKVEPAEVEPAKVEPAEVEPAEVEPAEVEPAEVQPAEVEPAKVEPATPGPTPVPKRKGDTFPWPTP